MKMIKDISSMICALDAESSDWQDDVYNKTGLWINPVTRGGEDNIILVSTCGYADIDLFTEYSSSAADDENYQSIESVDQLIQYLRDYEDSWKILKDEELGVFNKSDLFWAIQDCIIMPKREDINRKKVFTDVRQPDGTIYKKRDDYYIHLLEKSDNSILLSYDLVDYETNEEEIFFNGKNLDDCIIAICAIMEKSIKSIVDELYDEEYICFVPKLEMKHDVPKSLIELKERFANLDIYKIH